MYSNVCTALCIYVCMYVVVWSMLSLTIVRRLLGHSDVVYSLAMDGKCSVIISGSHNQVSHLSVYLYIYSYHPCMYVCMYVCIIAGEKLVYHSAQSRGSGSAENRSCDLHHWSASHTYIHTYIQYPNGSSPIQVCIHA